MRGTRAWNSVPVVGPDSAALTYSTSVPDEGPVRIVRAARRCWPGCTSPSPANRQSPPSSPRSARTTCVRTRPSTVPCTTAYARVTPAADVASSAATVSTPVPSASASITVSRCHDVPSKRANRTSKRSAVPSAFASAYR